MRKWVFIFISLVSFYAASWAEVTLTARVDKNTLTLDDEVTLTVQVSGISGNVVMPQLPSLPAFNIYSRAMNHSSINGATTLLARYTLVPRMVGNVTIGPVTFTYQGKTYQTEPIPIQIYRSSTGATAPSTGAAAPANTSATPNIPKNLPPLQASLANQAAAHGTEPFFLVAAVSNPTPYVNESFTLAVRFYFSRDFSDAPYQKPTVTNLFMEDLEPTQGSQQIGNTLYRYEEQRYHLAAATPGQAVIGPASVRYREGFSPFAAFDRFFGGSGIGSTEKTVRSAPISVNVRPLPSGQPSSFYGAVGDGYTITANATPQKVAANEAVNVMVTVQGPGNLKATKNLEFPPLEGFKIYPAAASSKQGTGSNGKLTGYKIFKTVLVPVASGIYTIPSLEWSYFNPLTRSYKTIHTEPISLTVTPATKVEQEFHFSASAEPSNGFQTLSQDIRYLKMAYAPTENFLTRLSQLSKINWLVLLAIGVTTLFSLLGRKPLEKRKAFSTAKSQIKKASSGQMLSDALSTYLQQRFHIHTGSLPLKEIVAALRKQGITPGTAQSFALLWQRLEADRFAPLHADNPGTTHRLSDQALDVLNLLEREIK